MPFEEKFRTTIDFLRKYIPENARINKYKTHPQTMDVHLVNRLSLVQVCKLVDRGKCEQGLGIG